jgi:gas vesicle protein
MGYSTSSEREKMNTRRLLLAGVLIALLLAACSGYSNRDDNPADVVKNALEACENLDENKFSEHFCKEQKNTAKNIFAGASEYMGLSVDDVKKVLEYQFKGMKYEEKHREGGRAVVHVTGLARAEVNGDKYKELVRKAIKAEGETISDEHLDLLTKFVTGLSQEIEVAGDVELIREDNKWKICDNFDVIGFH